MRIYAAYKPPNNTLDLNELRGVLINEDTTVIASDFNCKNTWWNSTRICVQGRSFHDDSLTYDYSVVRPDQPKHYSNTNDDVIDIIVYKGLQAPPMQQ